MERKFIGGEFKAEGDRKAKGYGAVFGNKDLGGDVISPGAFVGLGDRRVRMLRDHDPTKVIGTWESVSQDEKGLRVEGVFARTPLGEETMELVSTRALEGLSIGYRTLDADRGPDGERSSSKPRGTPGARRERPRRLLPRRLRSCRPCATLAAT